jgi:serine phosphatase RsbU (regulator of sigma subunit)
MKNSAIEIGKNLFTSNFLTMRIKGIRSMFNRIPVRVSMPFVLTMPALGVVLVLSVLAFEQGKTTVNDLMAQNLDQIHGQIKKRLDELLKVPGRINRINAHLIAQGKLDVSDLRGWRQTFFEQMLAFDMSSSIAWGGANGHAVWVARYPSQEAHVYAIKDDQTGENIYEYLLDSTGKIHRERSGIYAYDPRSRPWYKAAIKADKPTWSKIYAWLSKDGSESILGMGFVQPVRNAAGELLGVIDAEISLHDISRFLETLKVGRSGRAFVIDLKGQLIATSTGTPVADAEHKRLSASESYNYYIAAAAKYIHKEFTSLKTITMRYQVRLIDKKEPHLLMISPFDHETGLSWLIVTMVPESDFMANLEAGRQRAILMGIATVCITVALGLVLAYIGIRALLNLVGHVRRIGKGDLEHELHLNYSPEFTRLSDEINAMTVGLRDLMRLRHSLALAMEVQQSLLPSENPDIDGLDIAGHSAYCDETGGDYYDFLDITGLSDTTAAIAVGDVVGHGVAAAMLMATARGVLRSQCQEPGTLADLLKNMNSLLVEDTGGERFMTMLLMTIDAASGQLRWATAGHEPPFAYDTHSDCFIELKGSGYPLGMMDGVTYDEYNFASVRTGQVYVASTDGIWETVDAKGELFGTNRLRELIRHNAHLSATEISEGISKDLEEYRGGSRQRDDIAFVVIKVL